MNPIPSNWFTQVSSRTDHTKQQSTPQNNGVEHQPQQHFIHSQKTPRSRAIVFDTMVDDIWKATRGAASPAANVRRQMTIRNDFDEQESPKQYFIHSQHTSQSSFATNVKTFFAAARILENEDDSLYWCE